jgi:single-strand DNA-binding protein
LQTRKWTDKDGQERYSTEVVIGRFKGELTLLDGRSGEGGSSGGGGGDYENGSRSGGSGGGGQRSGGGGGGGGQSWQPPADLDDEIPF